MSSDQISRRAVVAAGVAAVAVAGPMAFGRLVSSSEEKQSRSRRAPRIVQQTERDQWEELVGQSFRIVTEQGYAGAVLAAVTRMEFDPERPAELARQQPFYAYFTVGMSMAPEGQRTYTMIRPDGETIELFLGRGDDRGNAASFNALFN